MHDRSADSRRENHIDAMMHEKYHKRTGFR